MQHTPPNKNSNLIAQHKPIPISIYFLLCFWLCFFFCLYSQTENVERSPEYTRAGRKGSLETTLYTECRFPPTTVTCKKKKKKKIKENGLTWTMKCPIRLRTCTLVEEYRCHTSWTRADMAPSWDAWKWSLKLWVGPKFWDGPPKLANRRFSWVFFLQRKQLGGGDSTFSKHRLGSEALSCRQHSHRLTGLTAPRPHVSSFLLVRTLNFIF